MEEERTWDLSVLVTQTSVEELTDSANSYLGVIRRVLEDVRSQSRVDGRNLLKFIQSYEQALEKLLTIVAFASCSYASDMTAEGSQALAFIKQRYWNESEGLRQSLQSILGTLVKEQPEILDSPKLKDYKHLLIRSSQRLPYLLSHNEEELISEKDTTGISALSQLRESLLGEKVLDVEIDGEMESLSLNRGASLFVSENRENRKNALDAYFSAFEEDKMLHGSTLRAICTDHVNMTRRRNLPSFMAQSCIDQDVDEKSIHSILKTLESNTDCIQKYLQMKAEHFGQDRLIAYDRVAPWFPKTLWKSDWSNAKQSVINAYRSFDHEFGDVVEDLFTKRRIDSLDRPGRVPIPGFCFGISEKKTSFLFLTYNDTLDNAYTLAHELGHAVHNHFMFKQCSVLNESYISLCMAETGSIFGELLFSEQLFKECDTDRLRIEILTLVLDKFFQKTFNVGLWAFFEQKIYEFIDSGGILDSESACDIWKDVRFKMYGDALEWTKSMDYMWAVMPHIFFPNRRFYNYPYIFAQLLVFALFDDYKQHPSDFAARFKRLLSRGSSMSPREQIAEMGYDITRPDFWTLGIRRAEKFLDELERLT